VQCSSLVEETESGRVILFGDANERCCESGIGIGTIGCVNIETRAPFQGSKKGRYKTLTDPSCCSNRNPIKLFTRA